MNLEIYNGNWDKLTKEEKFFHLKNFALGSDLYVVCVDDEESILEILKFKIEELGFSVFCTTYTEEALNFIRDHKNQIVLIVSDFRMGKTDGFEFRQQTKNISLEIPFAIFSGFIDKEMALRGMELKICSFLNKPFDMNNFISLLNNEGWSRLKTIREEMDLLRGFTDDASTLIEQTEELILELEDHTNNPDAISKIFGMIHTIKGSSGFFEPRSLHQFAHRFEDSLKEIQSGQKILTPQLITVWLKSCDILKTFIDEFKTAKHKQYDINELIKIFTEVNPETFNNHLSSNIRDTKDSLHVKNIAVATSKSKAPQELKVAVSLLDEFMQISGEMTVIRNMINKVVRSIEKQYPSDKDVILLGELLNELHKINGSVQAKITEIRKVPIRNVIKPLGRIIRDVSQSLNKEVELKVEGDSIRVDTSVAEVLSNSLIHLIRNSLDHGIEHPEERIKNGKNKKGSIEIESEIKGEIIYIHIKDDGKGINPETIKNKLLKNGTHTLEQINEMTENELQQMIFSSGFSTAQQITDISGRGVGMSMVKDVVEAIGGKILINSNVGIGTEFILVIPIPKSVLITNCLFITVSNGLSTHDSTMQFGIPQDEIKRVINFDEAQTKKWIQKLEGTTVLNIDNRLIPVVFLNQILNLTSSTTTSLLPNQGYLVVLSHNNKEFCLWVENVLDVEDTVVKSISSGQIKNLGLYIGATFIGDGSVGLILNTEGIANKAGVVLQTEKLQIKSKDEYTLNSNSNLKNNNYIICDIVGKTYYAISQSKIFRIEEFRPDQLQNSSNEIVTSYRNKILTFIDLNQFFTNSYNHKPILSNDRTFITIVVQHQDSYLGFVINKVIDLFSSSSKPEIGNIKQIGCQGWLLHEESLFQLLNIDEIIERVLNPEALLEDLQKDGAA